MNLTHRQQQLKAIGSNSIVTSTDNEESKYGTGQQISEMMNIKHILFLPSINL